MLKNIKNKVYFWRITTSKWHPFGGMAHLHYTLLQTARNAMDADANKIRLRKRQC